MPFFQFLYPPRVEARQISLKNIYDIAEWCAGVVVDDESIEIRRYGFSDHSVFAFPGDWIIKNRPNDFRVMTYTQFADIYIEVL